MDGGSLLLGKFKRVKWYIMSSQMKLSMLIVLK
uniref:Uncharacterized protein n=1 Tax=Arundo donax TaxID=35708 RepID=A0A0A9HMB4_ARUDO